MKRAYDGGGFLKNALPVAAGIGAIVGGAVLLSGGGNDDDPNATNTQPVDNGVADNPDRRDPDFVDPDDVDPDGSGNGSGE